MIKIQQFLRQYQPQAEEVTVWGDKFPLRVISYFCDQLPPLEFVTSVRGIVLRDNEVLVLRNRDETHIVPGGRREAGEQPADTLRREILEETGWLTGDNQLLGVWHFHHLAPKPADFPYLHPDFLQLIYTTKALSHAPEAKQPDDYELEYRFVPIEEVMKLEFRQPSQVKFLKLAVSKLGVRR
jgi:8-oxo-dGTP pyrophosphatase MutT (NUDIX family)